MLKYILKRILYIIPVMFGVIVLVFIMKTVTPGDPVASLLPGTATEEMKNNLREQLGLNDPVLKQFGSYVLGVVQGDLGTSYKTRQPVAQEIAMRLPNTITIAIWAMFIGTDHCNTTRHSGCGKAKFGCRQHHRRFYHDRCFCTGFLAGIDADSVVCD